VNIHIPKFPPRFTVKQFSDFGPWQVRDVSLRIQPSTIVATCPDKEAAEAIAKFLNGDIEGAQKARRWFLAVREEEDA
jgi:hypothetical protein